MSKMLDITAVAGIASLAQTLGSFVAISSQEMWKEADGHGNRRFGRSGLWFSGVLGSHQFSDAAGQLADIFFLSVIKIRINICIMLAMY